MTDFVTALAKRYPNRTFGRFNHATDNVQIQFYRAVGGRASDFAPRLRAAERALKKQPNYRSFLACGSEHCSFDRSTFYTTTVGGARLRDWVADLAAGKDVDCPECRPRGQPKVITLRMPSWASISSKPWLTSSSVSRWERSASTSISPGEPAVDEQRHLRPALHAAERASR